MSRIENKLKWCLDKAKNEPEHKHRGLRKVEPNKREAHEHVAKAEHNLKTLLYLKEGGFTDWCVSAGFYCIYHCLLAILVKNGYESRNQECTIAAVESLVEQSTISLDSKFIEALKQHTTHEESRVIDLRELFQYGVRTKAAAQDIEPVIDLCKEAIDATKEILAR